MTRVLIFPDIHNKWRQVDQILAAESWDRVICTGDYFDDFSDGPTQARDTALWVKARLADSRFTLLVGNHDLGYVYPNSAANQCSGFSRAKSLAVLDVLTQRELESLKLYHAEQDILFTHAGFDRDLAAMLEDMGDMFPQQVTLKGLTEFLDRVYPEVHARFASGREHPLLGAGYNRGGYQPVGGIIWQDFCDHKAILGVRQIMGHTRHYPNDGPLMRFPGAQGVPVAKYLTSKIRPEWMARGWSLCMDTSLHHYAILENGALTVKALKWDRPRGQDDYSVTIGETIFETNLAGEQQEDAA